MAKEFEMPPYARFLDYVSKLFPIVVSFVVGVLWFGDRVESPEEKIARIKIYTSPLEREIERLSKRLDQHESQIDAHQAQPGHIGVSHRIQSLESRILRLEDRK